MQWLSIVARIDRHIMHQICMCEAWRAVLLTHPIRGYLRDVQVVRARRRAARVGRSRAPARRALLLIIVILIMIYINLLCDIENSRYEAKYVYVIQCAYVLE